MKYHVRKYWATEDQYLEIYAKSPAKAAAWAVACHCDHDENEDVDVFVRHCSRAKWVLYTVSVRTTYKAKPKSQPSTNERKTT